MLEYNLVYHLVSMTCDFDLILIAQLLTWFDISFLIYLLPYVIYVFILGGIQKQCTDKKWTTN